MGCIVIMVIVIGLCAMCTLHMLYSINVRQVVYKGHHNSCKTFLLSTTTTIIITQLSPSYIHSQILMIVCLFANHFKRASSYLLRKSGHRVQVALEIWWLKLVVQQKWFEFNFPKAYDLLKSWEQATTSK